MPQIEICCFSLASCLVAEKGGADRIELCSSILEGGITPSFGLMYQAKKKVNVPIYAMIRPRGGDFLYSELEFEVMKHDVLVAKQCGVAGVVVGILLPDGRVDVPRTAELVKLASPLGVTFHRAFDRVSDPFNALEDVIATGCERILTSGLENKAMDGISMLKKFIEQANGRIELMAGSGITAENVLSFAEIGVQAVHFSAKEFVKSKMDFQRTNVQMFAESLPSEEGCYEASLKSILKTKLALLEHQE